MNVEEVQIQLFAEFGYVNSSSQLFNEKILAVRKEDLVHERVWFWRLLRHFLQRLADFGAFQVVRLAHTGKRVASQKIHERKAGGVRFNLLNDGIALAESGEPVAKSGDGDFEINGRFDDAIGWFFVEWVQLGGHLGTLWTPPILPRCPFILTPSRKIMRAEISCIETMCISSDLIWDSKVKQPN